MHFHPLKAFALTDELYSCVSWTLNVRIFNFFLERGIAALYGAVPSSSKLCLEHILFDLRHNYRLGVLQGKFNLSREWV